MAQVQLADIYNPLTFASRIQEAQIELNKFLNSGILVPDSAMANQVQPGGNVGEITNYTPLGTPEPNYSNDDPTDTSTPNKIASAKMKFRLAFQNQSWSTMDLAREIALVDPVGAITSKIGQYWATINERRLINSALGMLADNVANDAGDMVVSVASDDASAVTDAERIGADAILDAKQTLGDHSEQLSALGVHSTILTRLQKQNLIIYIPNARGEVVIPTYLGYTLLTDDSMPAVAGTNRITYTCILFGRGAFGGVELSPPNPSTRKYDDDKGNGGGQETLFSRRTDLIHPIGFSFDSAVVAGQSATYTELKNAANWDRVWDRKHIPLAFIEVND